MVHQIWHTNMNYSSYVASRRQNIGAKSLSQLENNGTTFSLAWTLSMSQITLVHWIMNNSTIDPWKVNLLPSQEHYDLKLDLVTLHVWVGPNAPFFLWVHLHFMWHFFVFYLFFFLSMWWTTTKTTLQMMGWGNLNLSQNQISKYILFKIFVKKFELLAIFSLN